MLPCGGGLQANGSAFVDGRIPSDGLIRGPACRVEREPHCSFPQSAELYLNVVNVTDVFRLVCNLLTSIRLDDLRSSTEPRREVQGRRKCSPRLEQTSYTRYNVYSCNFRGRFSRPVTATPVTRASRVSCLAAQINTHIIST